jgi:hypothetical protein
MELKSRFDSVSYRVYFSAILVDIIYIVVTRVSLCDQSQFPY